MPCVSLRLDLDLAPNFQEVGRRKIEQIDRSNRGCGTSYEPMNPLQALRARCLDCCAQQPKDVALCPAVGCPSWPFRMGTHPWRKPASEARREAARRTMAKLNARRNRGGAEPSPTASVN